MLVYDISKEKTFHAVQKWLNEIREQVDDNVDVINILFQVLLVGNKNDLEIER